MVCNTCRHLAEEMTVLTFSTDSVMSFVLFWSLNNKNRQFWNKDTDYLLKLYGVVMCKDCHLTVHLKWTFPLLQFRGEPDSSSAVAIPITGQCWWVEKQWIIIIITIIIIMIIKYSVWWFDAKWIKASAMSYFSFRCAHQDSGLTTGTWPTLCQCTEAWRDWASQIGKPPFT